MTKSQLRTLQFAANVIEQLSETDRKNESLEPVYRSAIGGTEDELGMLLHCANEHPEVFEHPYWNDELADVILKGNTSKEITYTASIERESNGDYQLTFVGQQEDEDDLDGNYQNYVTEDEAKEDIATLIAAGYKIEIE